MKTPINIVYGVEDAPPLGVMLLSGFQHVGLASIILVFPLLVTREAGIPPRLALDVLGVSMLVLGAGALLQAIPRGPIGSGFLCPPVFAAAYLSPSLLAINTGGLPLVFGMTVFGGLLEIALSRFLRPLRPFFPPEISGFVVLMVGLSVGSFGLRELLGVGAASSLSPAHLAVAAITLATTVGLNIWTHGGPRFFCVLLGMIIGYAVAATLGVLTWSDFAAVGAAPLVHVPSMAHLGWSFDLRYAIPFGVAALASCLRVMGDVTVCQKTNDAEWVRPDIRSLSGGVMANGLTNALAGGLGTLGVNTYTSSIGLAAATGVTSRRIAYAIGGIFCGLAFLPKASAALMIMPRPVVAVTLLFAASFIFVNGLQIIPSRMLDARRTFVVGLSFMAGIAVDLFPGALTEAPEELRPLMSSSLVLGTLSALVLNVVFRLGVRQTETLHVEPGPLDARRLEDFVEARGAGWGARRDVIERARFNLTQSIETILESCEPQGPLTIEASFDEFNLDIRVSYTGAPLELPEGRPTNEEIMASEEGQRRLAGFLLRRHADQVQAVHRAGRSTVLFHFDH